ncbi:hypothetical protein [Stenotrophomonas beteli]|uniref:hypothetical protein n=1 Tax=Stenotrophomonas beteli TaxID=3384461 RepID=UPI00128F9FDF|nr:hypothetical protein [Stenotrophomonas maltophilia]
MLATFVCREISRWSCKPFLLELHRRCGGDGRNAVADPVRGVRTTIADAIDITLVIRRHEDEAFPGVAGLHRTGDTEPEPGIGIASDARPRLRP